jgi:phage terminase large subunit
VTPKVNFEDGIEAIRYIFPKLRIDKLNCQIGVRGLREYQREYDELRACYKAKALDNWATHIVDAIRYLAVNYRRLYDIPQPPTSYQTSI